ncbi:hypothetical protein [Crocosphaera sp.]|uniref:hypothetical protein n=1 Tax=Crocosphaera sp. TaxID=2729996 RepID=UPI003F215637|nr:hypothetical protein [Crocosphaera sp.]
MKLTLSLETVKKSPLLQSLCCVALNPGLRSLLLFDSSPMGLQQIGSLLVSLLKVTTNCENVVPVKLGTFESEDDWWGQMSFGNQLETSAFQWQPGLLGQGENSDEIRLIIIPDLTQLSLAAMRACVVLMGADVAHLERHGQGKILQPNVCWLVGLSSQKEEIGKISPHLLDRFALRLNGKFQDNRNRITQIKQLLEQERKKELLSDEPEIDVELQQWLQQAYLMKPAMTGEALERILNYSSVSNIYHRRDISLTRFSTAFAQLENAEQVTVNHVDSVAQMIGLTLSENSTENRKIEQQKSTEVVEFEDFSDSETPILPVLTSNEQANNNREISVNKPEQSNSLPTIIIPEIAPLKEPYQEDDAPIEREMASLKLPTAGFRQKTIAKGTIIGAEKTNNAQDLDIIRTVLEAAKFYKIRQKNQQNNEQKLTILPTDLYRHRRAPVAEQMLTLLIDYTCLDNCQWEDQLLPYISWAYTQRASVALIQVGIAPENIDPSTIQINPQELRAKKIFAQSILVPSIGRGLDLDETQKGKATPLAHGLDLTLNTLRHALQHGKNTIHKAILVVISDGRGNVPIEASYLGKIQTPVGRKGVEDALEIAQKIGNLDQVETIFLNPQSQQYPELPLLLAKALGAKVVSIPPSETWEVEEWEI